MSRAVRGAALALLICATVGACDVGDRGETRTVKSPPATAASCAEGAIHWGGSTREWQLVAVSPVVKVSKSDGWVTYPLIPVRTFEPRVEVSEPSVSARRVYAALAERVDMDASVLAKPDEVMADRLKKGVRADSDGGGRFVEAAAVQVLRSSFTVACPGTATPVYGSVTAWYGTGSGSLQCGVSPGRAAWMKEAYELTCGQA
ncbi:hypothetical protein ABZ848_18930 [Streptomyces sp. NPDC047081]|uniref:hypothetical protein n=1 Tax=Streptomyces sp. NPDC047081 TaxID=3154706 RepID=UPI0033DF3B03